MAPEQVGAWASAGREVFLHLEVEDSSVSAEAVSAGVAAAAAAGDGEAGDTGTRDAVGGEAGCGLIRHTV